MATQAKLVVIGQLQFRDFGGSEIIALELAELFAERGHDVVIATRVMGDPIMQQVAGNPRISVRLWDEPDWNTELADRDVALLWVQHHVVPPALLLRMAEFPTVFSHMSADPLEVPLAAQFEREFADISLFNSPATLVKHQAAGWLNGPTYDRARVFPNPAPAAFFDIETPPPADLGRLLVVTNHIPDDLLDALERLPSDIEIRQVGAQVRRGSQPVRLKPADLAEVDAVVTIGKTVQYALAAGRPVYCYDYFGGPGWLTPQNFEHSRFRNFSGRGTGHKAPSMIAEELVHGYSKARDSVPYFRRMASDEFHLSACIDDILLAAQSQFATRGDRPFPRQTAIDHRITQDAFSAVFVSRTDFRSLAQSRDAAARDERRRGAALESKLLDSQRVIRELRENLQALSLTETRLRRRWRAQSAARRDVAQELRRAEDEKRRISDELMRLRGSLSWRITAPLRMLGAVVRRGRRGNW